MDRHRDLEMRDYLDRLAPEDDLARIGLRLQRDVAISRTFVAGAAPRLPAGRGAYESLAVLVHTARLLSTCPICFTCVSLTSP
jgi:hypothetical protein